MRTVLELFLLEIVLQIKGLYSSCHIAQNVFFLKTLKAALKKVELGSLFIKIKFLACCSFSLVAWCLSCVVALEVVPVGYMYFINSPWFSQMTPTFAEKALN